MTTIPLTSPSFGAGEPIPAKHTCDGSNLSPALKWSHLPKNAKSLALICDDPDAPGGTWVHWVLYNLPASLIELPEGVPNIHLLPTGAEQGVNDFRTVVTADLVLRTVAPLFLQTLCPGLGVHPGQAQPRKTCSAPWNATSRRRYLMGTYKESELAPEMMVAVFVRTADPVTRRPRRRSRRFACFASFSIWTWTPFTPPSSNRTSRSCAAAGDRRQPAHATGRGVRRQL